jgi:hypothetical protein
MAFCPLCKYWGRGQRARTELIPGERFCEACVQDSNERCLNKRERAARKDMLSTTPAMLLTQYAEMPDAPPAEVDGAVQSAPEKLRARLTAYHRELVRRHTEKTQRAAAVAAQREHAEHVAKMRAAGRTPTDPSGASSSSSTGPAGDGPANPSSSTTATQDATPGSSSTTPATSSAKNGTTDPTEADTQPTTIRKGHHAPSGKKGK